jgi:hypothetical protein
MKPIKNAILGLICLTALFFGATSTSLAQPTNGRLGLRPGLSIVPLFTNNPGAMLVITNLLQTPSPMLTVPTVSQSGGVSGTFWTLKGAPVPLPFNPYPNLPVYQISTNHEFLIDNRSVDFAALAAIEAAAAKTNQVVLSRSEIDTNQLWLDVPTNALTGSNLFNVVLRHTVVGKYYEVLTLTDLTLTNWTVAQTVVANGAATPVTLTQDARTNLFVWAREVVIPIYTQPLSQEVFRGDRVTFTVAVGGHDVSYQWLFNGVTISGATGSRYTIDYATYSDGGDYACIITSAEGTVTSTTAQLLVNQWNQGMDAMPVVGARQDYIFRKGLTYAVAATVQLTGTTIMEGGTVIKFVTSQPYPCLQVLGTLITEGERYDPIVLTSVDDLSVGYLFQGSGYPQPTFTGVPFLDLTLAGNVVLNHVVFRYADAAVSTPYLGTLAVWDSQFFHCAAAVLNEFGGVNSFHNVLFAECYDAVYAFTNQFILEAEQITADVNHVWESPGLPARVSVTNSIIYGSLGNALVKSVVATALNPSATNFQTSGAGTYYLAENSALHRAGNPNISRRLWHSFRQQTTYAPLSLPALLTNSGSLTLAPRVPRYTNGAPDLGYHYDLLDYTAAQLVNFGSITLLPGTVMGTRNEAVGSLYTWWGFDLREGSSFSSHGLPSQRSIITDVQRVQEQDLPAPSIALLLADCRRPPPAPGPVIDVAFTDFYAGIGYFHVCGGMDEAGILNSDSSVVQWRMTDCTLVGGKVNLGVPDNGNYGVAYTNYYGTATVEWRNSLFDRVGINLNPGFYWYDGTVNVAMAFTARNNLFRRNSELVLGLSAAGADWLLADNVFEATEFYQYPAWFDHFAPLPLAFDHNAYVPLKHFYFSNDAGQLVAATNSASGQHDVVLNYPLPYTNAAFGHYYLTTLTPLYQAGSRPAGAAGLSEYTTFADQFRAPSNSPVSIGLHYVAATNNSSLITNPAPLDTDADGVPDYVEAEHGTDLHNPMTDGVTNDTYNVAYDDVDLSGNGLVGRIKKALGLNPLDRNNPLTLKQVAHDETNGIVTFEVPVSYDLLTNIGSLYLLADGGKAASFQEFDRNTNGNSLLRWNSTFDPPGNHFVQVQFVLNRNHRKSSTPDFTILTGTGKLIPFLSTNACQFDPFYSAFDNGGAILFARLPELVADYTIELKTASGNHIRTITNSTTSGEIFESWDLTDDNGNAFAGLATEAYFTIKDAVGGSKKSKFWLTRTAIIRPLDGNFTVAYAWDNASLANGSMRTAIQHGVVNPLISPEQTGGGGHANHYDSTFNQYTWSGDLQGDPGYLTSTDHAVALVANLKEDQSMNFYFNGHGSATTIGDAPPDENGQQQGSISIGSSVVALKLGNKSNITNAADWYHPYRFVFLDACDTADKREWAHAFGILDSMTGEQVFSQPWKVQAFVGYIGSPRGPDSNDEWYEMAKTYVVFNDLWMNQFPLQECIDTASKTKPFGNSLPITLGFPFGKKFDIFHTSPPLNLIRPEDISVNNFSLKVYGYPWIKRTGYELH